MKEIFFLIACSKTLIEVMDMMHKTFYNTSVIKMFNTYIMMGISELFFDNLKGKSGLLMPYVIILTF